uniref:Uncharacterized protein n=1 Tax=Acrobeloides nanus TaxID=290746 RepID=A0A914CKS4_9BILA
MQDPCIDCNHEKCIAEGCPKKSCKCSDFIHEYCGRHIPACICCRDCLRAPFQHGTCPAEGCELKSCSCEQSICPVCDRHCDVHAENLDSNKEN